MANLVYAIYTKWFRDKNGDYDYVTETEYFMAGSLEQASKMITGNIIDIRWATDKEIKNYQDNY
jgi:hypothetical protein